MDTTYAVTSLPVQQRTYRMAASGEAQVFVVSPCEMYQRAWKSLLESQGVAHPVRTTTALSEIALPAGGGGPVTILVDAPGSEYHLALQMGPLFRQCHALFVVNDYELPTILPLLKLGVTGFMSRRDSVSNFVQAFQATTHGQIGLPPDVATRAMAELANGQRYHPALPGELTPRESEVLQLLADGLSNRDIAQTLFLSVRTVEAHLRSLYGKLDVSSRTEAALWAVRHGHAKFA